MIADVLPIDISPRRMNIRTEDSGSVSWRFTRLMNLIAWVILVQCGGASSLSARDISELDQHFNEPGADFSPWIFVPDENIRELSTEEHPGLVTLYEAGKGRDVKGILKQPIGIKDYALPWEFQTSLVQSFNLMAGVGAKTQVNSAIGLNVAVTFSNPDTWPADRKQRPPKTHEFQLLVVHLGSTGEAGLGLPQYSGEPHPETYLVWGRGDLGHTAMGDWRIPYVWIGDGAKYAGPASPQLYFRCVMLGPTELQVGIKFEASHGWNMRTIDCSEYGKITGVWEIGPIISADRWIPDVLTRNLPQLKGPHPLFIGEGASPAGGPQKMTPVRAPKPEPPNPDYEYYIDYCVFFGSNPRPFEKFSDEFNIPGYLGRWQVQEQCTLMDTHSYPGNLMLKSIGPGLGTGFGAAGGSALKLSDYPPPWEIETRFAGPDDSAPWNYWMNFIVVDNDGKNRGMWTPGIENDAKAKTHRVYPGASFQLKFPTGMDALLAKKPVSMLIQCIDRSHVRLGFRASSNDPWVFSDVFDVKKELGYEVGSFDMHCWSTTTGRMYGARPGSPMYQKILVDYVRYRYGRTK